MALRRARSSCTVFALAAALLLQLQHMQFSKPRVRGPSGKAMSADDFQRAAFTLAALSPRPPVKTQCRYRCTASGEDMPSSSAPQSSRYNALPSFEEATEKFYGFADERREFLLAGAMKIVGRHGLQEIVGIDIKHKHFEMPIDHCLLE
eukprot:1024996-Amphidinium_carterae.1